MKLVLTIVVIALVGYSLGLIFETALSGDESKLMRLSSTGQFDSEWIPFFLDAEMAQIRSLENNAITEFISFPKLLQIGELHGQDPNLISTSNTAIDMSVVKTIFDGKPILQNVVDRCYFHAEQNFGPLCVICKILDKDGQVVGAGMVKEDKNYYASNTVEIKLTPVQPSSHQNGDNDEEDDDNHEYEKDYEKDHNDEDDYRNYFDNKDFNKHFSKEDLDRKSVV